MSTGIRLFIRDALEAAAVSVGALTFAIPTTLDGAKALALVIAVAAGSAIWAVARRELWPILLNAIFPKPPSG